MTASERRRLWILALFLVLVTAVPYFVAFQNQGEQWGFTGSLIGVEDGNSYIAKMLRGHSGDWLFRTPYTTLPQRGAPVFLPYLLLGKLAGGTEVHLQLVVIFHLFRVAAVFIAVFGTYRFVAVFLRDPERRLWATAVATFGAGLGWILPLIGGLPGWPGLPLSFISPEAFGFLGLFAVPHQAMARGFLLLTLAGDLATLESDQADWQTPVLALITFLLNPITGSVAMAVIAAHRLALLGAVSHRGGWDRWWRSLGCAARTFSLALPYLVLLLTSYARDPFLRGWAAQNQILSPHLGYYLLAYGLLLIPAGFGAWKLLQSPVTASLLPVAWLLLLPALAYAPLGIQRRLTEGGWVIIVTLAAIGLSQWDPTSWRKTAVWGSFFALSLPSSLMVLLGSLEGAREPSLGPFVPWDQVAAFRFIGEEGNDGDVVLADYRASNALPAWAPARVPIGHGPESLELESHREIVDQFFSAQSMDTRRNILDRYGADWFLVGPGAKTGVEWEAVDSPTSWEQAGEWGQYSVFRVRLGP